MKTGLENTSEEMIPLFHTDVDGKVVNRKILGRRNYCIINGPTAPTSTKLPLSFTLQVETHGASKAKPYSLLVPPLL